ncbi:FAD-dependent oxidoreductase, partial [Mesorhizobium sp. M2E.F.Ca.ET.166.01.1.1]
APPRDVSELDRFASRTSGHRWLGEEDIAELEPDLAGRFRRGLFFPDEAHLDPRRAMAALHDKLVAMGVLFRFATDGEGLPGFNYEVDCRGIAANDAALRGVRGE